MNVISKQLFLERLRVISITRLTHLRGIATTSTAYYCKRSPPGGKPDPSRTEGYDPEFLADIRKRIEENKRLLRRHAVAHMKNRELSSSIGNLRASMASAQQKHAAMASAENSIANIPGHVSIEVLSNGTTHLRPCVAIRTPLKAYLLNCPEGSSRFLAQLRLKALNVNDIFITRSTWDNIAGISSILLSKEVNALPTRIHGSTNVKQFLECIRPFQDSDYGSTKYPSQVEERPYSMSSYEDAAMKVTYIPVSPPMSKENMFEKNIVDVNYLVELKSPPRRIDPRKLMSMQVPKGPWIGKLKSGETITLEGGKIIKPDDVYADEDVSDERSRVLFVDCSGVEQVRALRFNSTIRDLTKENSAKVIDLVVHLTSKAVMSTPEYDELVALFGDKTEHVVVNATAPMVPGIESIYRNHRLLNHICPAVFPKLHPQGWSGLVTQNDELQTTNGKLMIAAPLQRFWMRKGAWEDNDPIIADLREEMELSDEARELIDRFHSEASTSSEGVEFPRVSFLGTSSAVPSKYRNVTGYLVESSDTSAFMIDVGEGSYGQLKALLGVDGCHELLLKLHGVFITHAHQDHMNGLYTIIQRRREAFESAGMKYVPLVLVANQNVLKPLKNYTACFEDLTSFLEIVDISSFAISPPVSPGGPPNKRGRLQEPKSAIRNVIEMMPRPLFDEAKWALHEIKAVHVHHTRMANGFVLNAAGKRLVFSGDTMPCDLLVQEGKDADLLVHESTFEDGHEKDAFRKKHSTMGQAVDIGRRMGAKNIILTHFSARYPKVPALPPYLDEAGNVGVAMDNMRVRFGDLHLLPKLIPLYREVYHDELFEIEMRRSQRKLREQEEADAKKAGVELPPPKKGHTQRKKWGAHRPDGPPAVDDVKDGEAKSASPEANEAEKDAKETSGETVPSKKAHNQRKKSGANRMVDDTSAIAENGGESPRKSVSPGAAS